MATADTTARNSRASDWSSDYATATLEILEGSTVLATHTFANFAAPVNGVITANAITDATIATSGTADGARITAPSGVYTLVIGTDITLSTTTFIAGQTSSITSATVTFPA